MIFPEQQLFTIAHQRRQEAEAAASSYRLHRELGVDHEWRSGLGHLLIRLGQWIAPAEPKRTVRPAGYTAYGRRAASLKPA